MKIIRWIGVAVLLSFALMATLVALAPTLLSTSWGQGLCLKAASHVYAGSIQLDSLSIGWLSGVDLHNLKVKDPEGRDLFSCSQVELNRSLLPLVFSQKDFGSIKVVSPRMYCYASKNMPSSSHKEKSGQRTRSPETVNKQTPISINSQPVLPSAVPDLKGHVRVCDAQLVSCIDDKVVGTVSQGEVNLDLDLLHSSKGTLEASFSQGTSKPTPVSLAFFVDGAPQFHDIKGSLSICCTNVPTEVLAAFARSIHPDIADILKESFGNSLSYSLSATVNGPAMDVKSSLISDNVHSDITLNVESDLITLGKGDLLTGTLTPRLFSLLVNKTMPSQEPPITLLSPTVCSLENISPLSFHLSTFALTTPFNIRGYAKTPLLLSVGANKLPLSISLNSAIEGDPEKPSAIVDITASCASDTASLHLTASGSKKQAGYHVSTALNINGKWPTIAKTLTQFEATSVLGPECSGVVTAEGEVLSSGEVSINGKSTFSSQNIQKTASFSCTNTLFSLSQATLDAKIPSSLIEKYGVPPRFSKLITALAGPAGLHATMSGSYDISSSNATLDRASVSSSCMSIDVHDLKCSFENGVSLSLASPATARMTVDKDLVSLLSPSPLPCSLAAPAELSVTILPCTLCQKDGMWKGSQLAAELQGKNIQIAGQPPCGPYSFSIPTSLDIGRRTLTLEPLITCNSAQLLKGTLTASLKENGDLPFAEKITANCTIELSHLPTTLLERLSKQKLSAIIGTDLSSKLCCTFNGLSAKGNLVSASCSGDFWRANVNLALDELRLSSGSSSAVDIEACLTPQSFDAVTSLVGLNSDLTIGESVTAHLVVPQCTADLSPFISQDSKPVSLFEILDGLSLSARSSLSALLIRQKGASIGRLPPLTATCDLQGKNRALRFAIDTSDASNSDMTIAIHGSCDNLWNAKGLRLSSSHLRSTIDIDRFPTGLLDIALPKQGPLLEEAIGKTIRIVGDLSADEMKSGSVKLDLQSKNCSVHLDGMIDGGKMTLKNPAKASLSLTKEAGTLLLKNVNPLLATAAASQNPIQVTVDSQGAVIPLSPFSITGICLPKVTADVGKIVVKNGGALKIILALLNMGQAANNDNLDVWLTPIYMRVQGGVVTCQRADALVANKIHMITWGDVNLGHDAINMVVAIPQETLAALRLRMITSTPERGLQIPITGSASNPKIDTKSATAKLAGAAMVDNAPDPRLKIFGGLLQAAAAVAGEPDQPIPQQTTRPLPWER